MMTNETYVELTKTVTELLAKNPKFMEQIGVGDTWARDSARQIKQMVSVLARSLPEKK